MQPDGQIFRILVAEDHPINQKLMKHLLGRMGHVVDIASDGIQALQRLHDADYDIVLMDLHMPGMGGVEAAQHIRRLWPQGGPKVVFVTADTAETAQAACLAAGVASYIEKPVDREALLRELATSRSRLRPAA
jgi:CheY-like chemotaxis protein